MSKVIKVLFFLFIWVISLTYYTVRWADFSFLVVLVSLILTFQGLFTLTWMLYAWEDPEDTSRHKSPRTYLRPELSFTALLPARHEENVIRDTIKAISRIDYPENLKQVLVLCRADDLQTISRVKEEIHSIGKSNIQLITFNDYPVNKPHSLNIGLAHARNQVVTIFDAEDQPHPDIYRIVNTVMVSEKADVVQSGVQLMNFNSTWFSALNVMEYFFWFKSGLNFFTRAGKVTPLGGNTVFFKKSYLNKVGGWDEKCLTEDADIGFRLISAGARIKVVYDEIHATREETPATVACFIKQRSRWDHGFLQIMAKNKFRRLPFFRQNLLSAYVLLSPELQLASLIYLPFGFVLAFSQKLPVIISMISFLPLYVLAFQLLVTILGLYQFTRSYRLKFPWYMPLKIVIFFLPYQLLLAYSSLRAISRFVRGFTIWEKTQHLNAHRDIPSPYLFRPGYVS
jgi:cellulose synthase/poly-beta-1,6-N-acetylglucosamine synthase-like glycosyltransferase